MAYNSQIAINTDNLNKLMIDITNTADQINSIFSKIQSLVQETKEYYICSSASQLRSKYSLYNDNYKVIVRNIKSYKTDLSNLKKKYSSTFSDLSNKIRKDASNLDPGVSYIK